MAIRQRLPQFGLTVISVCELIHHLCPRYVTWYNDQGKVDWRDSGPQASSDSGVNKHIHLRRPQVRIKITAGVHKYTRDPAAPFQVT